MGNEAEQQREPGASPGASWMLPTGQSGDPLLKRLVDLSSLGWTARMAVISNGVLIRGTLVSVGVFREALAAAITRRGGDPSYAMLDDLVAAAVEADDPDPLWMQEGVPEPRYIHLADVQIGPNERLPFLRLRLPAVSGFWLDGEEDGEDAAG